MYVAARTAGFIHIRVQGKVACRAYGIGPAAVRIGHVTIVLGDRIAALSIVTAAMFFEDAAERLAPTYPKREGGVDPHGKNDITALVEFIGRQEVRDLSLTPAYMAADACGEASLTIGNVRITACDRDAAERIAKALADAYTEGVEAYTRLRPLAELREAHIGRRAADPERKTVRG